MYDLKNTTLTRFANRSNVAGIGLVGGAPSPVMCAPAAVGGAAAVGSAVVAGVGAAAGFAAKSAVEALVDSAKDQDFNACPDSVLDFTAAVTYTPPTRLAGPVTAPVPPSATVDRIIAARRGSAPLA